MIKLDSFPSYCENCGRFDPTANQMEITTISDRLPQYITVVTCSDMQRCNELYNHIKESNN